MATKILVVLVITSVLAYPTKARSLAMEAKGIDEQKEYFRHPLAPYFGGFGGLRGGNRPPFSVGGIGGNFGSGFFGPFGSISGVNVGSGIGFGSSIGGGGFGVISGGNNNPNDNGELGARVQGEGADAANGRDHLP